MPLMKGKSEGAFKHNVKAEMNSGKPQKQALAIAYSIKRKAKKMAEGGVVENEDLNPMHEPEHGAEMMVMRQMKLSPNAQNHEDLEEPAQPKEHVMPADEDMPSHMMAHGGMIDKLMSKRKMSYPVMKDRHYAEGGVVDEIGLNDQEVDPDNFLTANMTDSHFDHVTHEDESDLLADELHEPKKERRKMLMDIMAGLHRKHLGK